MGAAKHDGLAVPGRVVLAHEPPFQIGDLAVNPPTRQVECGPLGETLEPRVMQVLVALYQGGGIVTRDELVERCWDGRVVGDDSINRVVSRLRHIAADIGGGSFAIETITKVGYRLTLAGLGSTRSSAKDEPAAPIQSDRRKMVGAIVAAGAAELADSPAHLVYIATELRWRPDRLEAIAANGRQLATPGAARATAEAIVQRISRRSLITSNA